MDWGSMLAEISFPILVTFYLLTRIESKLEQLTISIQTLTQHVSRAAGARVHPEGYGMDTHSYQTRSSE